MKIMNLIKKKQVWIPVLILIILAGGFAVYSFGFQTENPEENSEQEVNTTTVRRGDIILSATGSGSLVAEVDVRLSFPTSGTAAFVNVQAGDSVEEGDIMAALEDTESLEADLNVKELELIQAQQELDELELTAASTLGEAQLAVAVAQDAYEDAQSALVLEGMVRCDDESLDAYYQQYIVYQEQLDELGESNDSQYYLDVIYPVEQLRNQAKASYDYCAGYTEYEIAASEAELIIAEAALQEAQERLTLLEENDGIDPDEWALAENKVKQAEIEYKAAVEDLEGATLVAPMDGTVMSVAGEAGDSVDTGTFIVIADLNHPYIEFFVDETDMDMVAVGYEAEVYFDALEDQVFKGTVTQVDPALVTESGYQVVHGTIALQAEMLEGKYLIEGMNASVDIIGGSAENALLVPVEALKDLGDSEYVVFVMDASGSPKLTAVEVGLMDYTYAEILSGLKQGDVVTTGIVETE